MVWWEGVYQYAGGINWTNIVPSVVGAVLGGTIAAFTGSRLARRASREILRRDRIARFENQKAATLRALVKLQTIVNGMETLYRQLEGMIANADAAGHSDMDLWQKVMPIVGFTEHSIRFEPEEITIFVSREVGYLNELLLLAERYATLESSFKTYAEHRGRLTDESPARMTGAAGTTEFTEAEYNKYAPRAHALNALVEQLRQFASADYEKALTVAEQFGPKARAELDDPSFPILGVDEARAQKAQMKINGGMHGTRE